MKRLYQSAKTAIRAFSQDDCMVHGAALAYYTIFSLPPLLVMVFFTSSWFGVSEERLGQIVQRQLGMPVAAEGETASDADKASSGVGIETLAKRQSTSVDAVSALGPAAKWIGIGILAFSATGVFAQLQNSLNQVWNVNPDPDRKGWKHFLLKRILSLGMIVVAAFLLLVSLVLTTLIEEIMHVVQGEAPSELALAIGFTLNTLLSLAVATALFAAVLKIFPDASIEWKDIWFGAAITAILFVSGKELIGYYLQNSNVGSSWGGAAASMIALLVWVYYTSLIILFGAEFAHAWASSAGGDVEPASNGAS